MRIRRSNTLADDEGKVFMTCVPSSPIQVIGRRDPRTGELCVGKVFASNDCKLPTADDATEVGFERVTGEEAERLVAQVYLDITTERTASWEE